MALNDKKKLLIPSSEGLYYNFSKRRIPVAISVSPILRGDQVLGAVEVFRDGSQEKEIDRAKSEFVSLASHQLRTPLTAVNWYTDILLAGETDNLSEDQLLYLQEMQESNSRMVKLVNALLNVSRIDLGTYIIEPEPCDLVALCKGIVRENEPNIFARQLKFSESYAVLPSMNIDPNLTKIMIENVITNAIKYTPKKGSVNLDISKDKKNAIITISDSGYGIPAHQKDKVFTKLFRADNIVKYETEGTGLGLYIAKSVAEAAGGSITFTSKKNKGTTFTIALPLSGMPERKGTRRLD